jgi:RHS repeat-associated protein
VQTDPNSLLYMRARYYNPYLCRFLNLDPAGFAGGLNFYGYADGNPISLLDPLGSRVGQGRTGHPKASVVLSSASRHGGWPDYPPGPVGTPMLRQAGVTAQRLMGSTD